MTTMNHICTTLLAALLASTPILVLAQESDEGGGGTEDASVPMEEIIVTGTRLERTPGELAGNLIVLDQTYIRATGEVSIERVLRQLPQNTNFTQERFGSDLNTATNLTGASTVNLRGLGSESTLILVDGRRLGHSGILGGVSDISSIPLAIVERIEVLLDGASAIYGSDAVGGVVNIITRKDYQGVEVSLDYGWPSDDGYDEVKGTIAGGFQFAGASVRASFTRSDHSGMDASDREATLFQQSIFPGPQFDIRSVTPVPSPILYRLGDDVLTVAEHRALSDEQKAMATAETSAVLPVGFDESSSVDDITQFGPASWGAATQVGNSLLPEQTRDTFTLNVTRPYGDAITASFWGSFENRSTTNELGYQGFSQAFLGAGNPFNPFGTNVRISGQRLDLPREYQETETETRDFGIELEGEIGASGWQWEARLGRRSESSDTQRVGTLNGEAIRGGLTYRPVRQTRRDLTQDECVAMEGRWVAFFGGYCQITFPPPDAVNPFGDISQYLQTTYADSLNRDTNFEAHLRGEFASLPGGSARALFGYQWQNKLLESATDFQLVTFESPTGRIVEFDTDTERSNQAVFLETWLPLVGAPNRRAGIDSLSLSVLGRWDSYDEPTVQYNLGDGGEMKAENLSDAGNEFTWNVGLVYAPVPDLRVRITRETAFVAPQLNQVLVATNIGPSQPFRGLLLQQPDGSLSFETIEVIEGGNSDLKSETADILSYGLELSPRFMPGFGFKVNWSDTEYKDRINRLSNTIVDPNNLPSDTFFDTTRNLYVQERRWINVSSIEREGVDYEVHYQLNSPLGEFRAHLRHARTTRYEFVVDPLAEPEPINVLSNTTANTAVGVVPRSGNDMQLSWRYRGAGIALNYSTTDETSTELAGVTRTYEPPKLLNLTLSYDFVAGGLLPAPRFMQGARLRFTVNNLGDDFGSTSVRNSAGEPLDQTGPDASPLYGRVFSLNLTMSLGQL